MKTLETITLKDAKKALSTMEIKAIKIGIGFSFCIVDACGSILLLEKMDNAKRSSVNMAIAKAETSLKTQISTRELHKSIKDNDFDFGYAAPSCKTAVPGGIPLFKKSNSINPGRYPFVQKE